MLNMLDSLGFPASWQQPTAQALNNKGFRKKLYVTAAALILVTAVIAAAFLVPSSEAETIPLGTHYVLGEKLTYNLTASSFSQTRNSSTNSTAQHTLTVEVVSIDGDTYTLKYTTTPSAADNSVATSYVMPVKEDDMTNLYTLLPVAFQQYPEYAEYAEKTNLSVPLETALFNQSEAKVGDTWQIPVACAISADLAAELTVKFVAIQNLAVEAGSFKVFKIAFTRTSAQQSSSQFDDLYAVSVSGESYLEFGSCKQVQSSVQVNMTTLQDVDGGYSSFVSTFQNTLIKDEISGI